MDQWLRYVAAALAVVVLSGAVNWAQRLADKQVVVVTSPCNCKDCRCDGGCHCK